MIFSEDGEKVRIRYYDFGKIEYQDFIRPELYIPRTH
jgi:hypothetical protein